MSVAKKRIWFFLWAAAFGALSAGAFTKMDTTRVLLMNNDTNGVWSVTDQTYANTNSDNAVYWEHSEEAVPVSLMSQPLWKLNVLPGVTHTLWQNVFDEDNQFVERRALWRLTKCRAGSSASRSNTLAANNSYPSGSKRNFIPWSTAYSVALNGGTLDLFQVGMVSMLNTTNACVTSPLYTDGLGTVYFDAVNGWTTCAGDLVLEVATESVSGESLGANDDVGDNLKWRVVPVDVLTVTRKTTVAVAATGVTSISLAQTDPSSTAATTHLWGNLFYRIRAQLNYRGPVRFRIRRTSTDSLSTQEESSGNYLILDNIVASYPPVEVDLRQYGVYDDTRRGTSVLGWTGAFTEPFPSAGQTNVFPQAYFIPEACPYVTNALPKDFGFEDCQFTYRWRYLDQMVGSWKTVALDRPTASSTQLVAQVAADFSDGVGDVEFYYALTMTKAPHYEPFDFACNIATDPYGAGWAEDATPWTVTYRRDAAEGTLAATCGTDWFVRLREGLSDVQQVNLALTYGDPFQTENRVESDQLMELTGNHTWRAFIAIPSNRWNQTAQFKFDVTTYAKAGTGFDISDMTLGADITTNNVPPYNAMASESAGWGETLLTDSSGYLLVEFNDATHSVSLSRGDYQNFNKWTDAAKGGYVVSSTDTNYPGMAGVSPEKKSYAQTFEDWPLRVSVGNYWVENFEVFDTVNTGYPYDKFFSTHKTPNGWQGENVMFISENYTAAYVTNSSTTHAMALQLEGRGKGSVSFADSAEMPDGLDSFSFSARVAQFLEFDDFAYYLDGNAETDYAIGAQVTMSVRGGTALDISPGAPSVSLVGYYRATKGCYELRLRRVSATQIEMALYRWNSIGGSLTATLLKKQLYTGNLLVPSTAAEDYQKWTGAYLAIYNGSDCTYLTVCFANQANVNSFSADTSYLVNKFDYVDSSDQRLTKGTYGVGSCECPAYFGRIAQYSVTAPASGKTTVTPLFTSSAGYNPENTSAALLKDEDNWALPGSRMALLSTSAETVQWGYGVKAVIPTQTLSLELAKTGSGSDWTDSGFVQTISSFRMKDYVFSPRRVESYNVRLQTGGTTEDDTRTDVVVDSLMLSQWHAGSSSDSDLAYPNGWTNWIYSQCWIEDLLTVGTGSSEDRSCYSIESIGNGGEYAYVFTKSCTFTPKVDITVSRALLVGGGGAGGNVMGGGGGGGGVVTNDAPLTLIAGREYVVTVGAGGAADLTGNNQNAGKAGGASSFKWNGALQYAEAKGGGGGAGWSANATSGGSGGGAANATARAAGSGTSGQGFAGGAAANGRGGGGGGAGGKGGNYVPGYTTNTGSTQAGQTTQNPYHARGGAGGDGLLSDITGTYAYYGAGGGGGAGWTAGYDNLGGAGGKSGTSGDTTAGTGGDAYNASGQSNVTAQKGADGYGGGGGGGGWNSNNAHLAARGAAGGSGAVILRMTAAGKLAIMQPRRAYPTSPVMVRSPYLNGLSLFSFTFQDADSNAVVRLQMATNTFGTADYRTLSMSLTDARWVDVTNFTFRGKDDTSGTKTCFVGLREPVWGFFRLLCEPDIVQKTYTNDYYGVTYPEYGSVTLVGAVAYDEPKLDARSWLGWDMLTTSETPYAYLPDPGSYPAGLAGALNWTALRDDPAGDYNDKMADESGSYAEHDPYIQSPAIRTTAGVGQVQFRARVMDTNATVASVVSLYGASDPQADDDDWIHIKDITVTNRTFATYLWKSTEDSSPYTAIRLVNHAAKYGRNGDPEKDDGQRAVTPIQRVLIDEIACTEPIAPGLTFKSVTPFRTNLKDDPVKPVADAASMDQQPLLGESWGVQVEAGLAQLSDELDVKSIHVYLSYYPSDDVWGHDNWTGNPNAVERLELARVGGADSTNLVWRSSYAVGYEDSVIPPMQDATGDGKGIVCQYFVWAEYKDTSGTNHQHTVLSSEWKNPSWYYPVDYNEANGAASDTARFCPYTILQTISPKRAWINCVNYFDGNVSASAKNQFIELSVPAGADMTGWYLRFSEQEKTRPNTTVFATLGLGGIASSKTSANIWNRYDFLTLQNYATTSAKGAADGTWSRFGLNQNSAAQGTFTVYDSYALELLRPNGIIEQQIVVGGTNQWEEYVFSSDYDPSALRDRLVARDAGTGAHWVLAGADRNAGSVGVMKGYGSNALDSGDSDWEENLVQTPQTRNRRADGALQDIDPDWYLLPLGTNMWVYSYIYGGHIAQVAGKESGDVIRLILPKGTTTNIVFTVDPWHRIAQMEANDAAVTPPAFDAATHTYTYPITDISENLTLKTTSGVDPSVDAQIPASDPYHDAVVHWLENFNCESNIIPCEVAMRNQPFQDKYLSLKEMYWLDIYPFQTNRLVVGITPPKAIEIPEDERDTSTTLPAVTNLRVSVYMMITNRETGAAHAPYTLQGLANESSATAYTDASPNWTSVTFKVTGNLLNIENTWRPLRYFVFGPDSFRPQGDPDEFTAEIDVWDPFSSKSPIYTDIDVRWWPYRGQNPVLRATIDETLKPVRVNTLKSVDHL